jgi:uncharacterized integral membrane protein
MTRSALLHRERSVSVDNISEPTVKYLSWIVTLPITVIVVIFAISNLDEVAFGFWPLDGTFSLPLYIAVLVAFVVGFICGGVVLWLSAGKVRRRMRKAEFEAVGLKHENARLKLQLSQQTAAQSHRSGGAGESASAGTAFQIGSDGHTQVNRSSTSGQQAGGTVTARLTGT